MALVSDLMTCLVPKIAQLLKHWTVMITTNNNNSNIEYLSCSLYMTMHAAVCYCRPNHGHTMAPPHRNGRKRESDRKRDYISGLDAFDIYFQFVAIIFRCVSYICSGRFAARKRAHCTGCNVSTAFVVDNVPPYSTVNTFLARFVVQRTSFNSLNIYLECCIFLCLYFIISLFW